MKKFAAVFLLLTLIKCSQQVRVNCTKLIQPNPSIVDLNSIAKEVNRIKALYNVPTLADYTNENDMKRDLHKYTQGLNNQDARLTISQLVKKYRFKLETHSTWTKDGYLLIIHRIPNPGNDAVLIHHGLFGSSIDWLMAGQDSLPYVLAGLGYDVWLGNFRGNKYSTKHESFTLDCAQYWDFSWDEFGNFDLPATIDYITHKTMQRKLSFVGYSVSTTAFLVMTSLLPDYNDKISSMIAIAPIAFNRNIKSPIIRSLTETELMEHRYKTALGSYMLKPSDALTQNLRKVICGNNAISPILCSDFSFLVTGFNYKLLDMNNFYTISQKYPSGTSTKTLLHYAQNFQSGQFRRYDHPGMSDNVAKYGSVNPTNYPLNKIRAKVSFIISKDDCLSNVTDVAKLRSRLHNVGDTVYAEGYSNVDYLWATNVRTQVYDKVVALIQKSKSF